MLVIDNLWRHQSANRVILRKPRESFSRAYRDPRHPALRAPLKIVAGGLTTSRTWVQMFLWRLRPCVLIKGNQRWQILIFLRLRGHRGHSTNRRSILVVALVLLEVLVKVQILLCLSEVSFLLPLLLGPRIVASGLVPPTREQEE